MRSSLTALLAFSVTLSLSGFSPAAERYVEISEDVLVDKIQGGLLGEILGNLNGLPHELKYNNAPGNVTSYIPGLPEGARTDDDTDIEWTYIYAMQKSGELFLSSERIVELWQTHMNGYIWCSNEYARRLMDVGIKPPLTGRIAVNPWSVFNISGQFVCEAFGMIAPGMPQTASKIGLHYTHVTIDGEPAQTTQLFDTMIAMAFIETDIEKIVTDGLVAVDPKCDIHNVVSDVQQWTRQFPDDWRKTWHAIHDKYAKYGGMRDFNGHELNTAAIIGALLYGKGDFVETVRLSFNFGWDADCNAATAASVIGVIKGRRWMEAQGWTVCDVYKNITRPGMPEDETITSYGHRLVAIAKDVIRKNGGKIQTVNGKKIIRIRTEKPANVEPLPQPLDRMEELRNDLIGTVREELTGTPQQRARAAYLAMCLGESEKLAKDEPEAWKQAIEALEQYPKLIEVLFKAPQPSGDVLQERAKAAGMTPPAKK